MPDKKFVKEYQPTDSEGKAIGPKQRFEAESAEELTDKLAAAHQNASGRLYETMRAAKLGIMMEPDPDRPINEFNERPLSAEERIKLTNSLQDPATMPEAFKTAIESVFGADVNTVREKLRSAEMRDRIDFIAKETDKFLQDHPEYHRSQRNQDTILKWLNKKGYAITANNLERAYTDLASVEGVLDIAPVSTPPVETPEPAVRLSAITDALPAPSTEVPATEIPEAQPTPSSEAIPPATTAAPQNSGSPAEVRPSKSSSGLSRNDASGSMPTTTAKASEITAQEIRRMSSAEYDERLQRDPAFAALVDKLYRK